MEGFIQVRDYEIERIAKKIKQWYPECKEDALVTLIEYTNSNLNLFLSITNDDEDLKLAFYSVLNYTAEVICSFYDIDFTKKQSAWLLEQMVELIYNMNNQIAQDNNN